MSKETLEVFAERLLTREEFLLELRNDLADHLDIVGDAWEFDPLLEALNDAYNRGAAAKPPAGVEVEDALAALDDFEHNPDTAIAYREQIDTIRSALEKCR